ncbi:MAG: hypothetical protein K9G71_10710 [Rhodobacteraceae bacterium]|nr:hypothetical protein [Paracoccaceae bacterium]MCF8514825.1 hypothetical protein [Paracoccaceae bacterium]MCF8519069.1 hypothetical protein [Paracoccaceae bacterium]
MGLFGSLASESPNTCKTNPYHIRFSSAPDHAIFEWDHPVTVYDGTTKSRVVYDVLGADDRGITMRLEGETRRADDGSTVIWILRPAIGGEGYCWSRTDWPLMRCQNAQARCPDDIPTS